jgi:hypothetical protein
MRLSSATRMWPDSFASGCPGDGESVLVVATSFATDNTLANVSNNISTTSSVNASRLHSRGSSSHHYHVSRPPASPKDSPPSSPRWKLGFITTTSLAHPRHPTARRRVHLGGSADSSLPHGVSPRRRRSNGWPFQQTKLTETATLERRKLGNLCQISPINFGRTAN